MTMQPLVSVITPVYNNQLTVLDAILSVKSQQYNNWELILIDDCSSDDSFKIISDAAEGDTRIKVSQTTSNSGAAHARNLGINLATGRFIAFLDADDMWTSDKLEKQVAFSIEKKAALTHTSYQYMDAKGKPLEKVIAAKKQLGYAEMLNYNYIGCLTAMYDTEVLGGKVLMPILKKRQDYALWLNILKMDHQAFGLDEVLAYYRTGMASLSSNKWEAIRYNFILLRYVEGLSLMRTLYHFSNYSIIGLKKYFFS